MGQAFVIGAMAVLQVAQADQQRKAQKKAEEGRAKQMEAQRKQQEAQQRIADIRAARERIQAARQARIQKAQILAQSGASGVTSSTVEGGVGSITSTTASNIGTGRQISGISKEATIFANQKSIEAQGLFGQSASAAGNATIFGAGASIASIFDTNVPNTSTTTSVPSLTGKVGEYTPFK